jgi:hypothetical protein
MTYRQRHQHDKTLFTRTSNPPELHKKGSDKPLEKSKSSKRTLSNKK